MKRIKQIALLLVFLTIFLLSCKKDNDKTEERTPVLVEIKKDQGNVADDIFKYLKEILTIIGLGAGIAIGLTALRKKLREDNIKKLLDETH